MTRRWSGRLDRTTIVEGIGALGVIASLLFVGVQVRQSAEATRAATVLQLKENWVQLNLTYLQSPETADAFAAVERVGYADADSRSQYLVAAAYRAIMHNWSNAYFQYRIGTLDDEQWGPLLRDIAVESPNAYIWLIWDEWQHIFDDPFQRLMDSLKTANFD